MLPLDTHEEAISSLQAACSKLGVLPRFVERSSEAVRTMTARPPSAFRILDEPLRRRRGTLRFVIFLAVISQAIGIPLALVTRRMVHAVGDYAKHHHPHQAERALLSYGLVLIALTLGRGAARWIKVAQRERLAHGLIAELRGRMFAHLQQLSLGYFDRRALGKTLVRFVGDAGSLRAWVGSVLIAVPADVLTILFVLIAISTINAWLVLAAALPPLVLVPAVLIINPRTRLLTREGRGEQSRLTGELSERLANIAQIKAAQAEVAQEAVVNQRIDRVREAFVKRGRLDAWTGAISITAGSMSLCAIGLVGSLMMLRQEMTVADIIGAIWLTVLLRSPVNRLARANKVRNRARVAAERIRALLERSPEPGLGEASAGLLPYTGTDQRIRLARLGYRDWSGTWLVRGVDHGLQGPGLVLLRGDQDAARTLLLLVLRLRRPQEGRVALDGTNAKKLRLADIRDRIGWLDHRRAIVGATLSVHGAEAVRPAWEQLSALAPDADFEFTVAGHIGRLDPPPVRNPASVRLALACASSGDRPILLLDDPLHGLGDVDAKRLCGVLADLARTRLVVVASGDPRLDGLGARVIVIPPPAFQEPAAHHVEPPAHAPEPSASRTGAPTTPS